MTRTIAPLHAFGAWLLLGAACGADTRELSGPALSRFVELGAATTVATSGLVPFDVDRDDLVGPDSHNAQYGKLPELVVAAYAGGFDVLARSQDETNGPRAFLVRVADGGTPSVERVFEVPTLGLVLGFVRAADGSVYYATGAPDDDLSQSYPAEGQHRRNVVRLYHVDADGAARFSVDVDIARAEFDPDAEPLVNPGVASSARLGLAGGQLALVAGNNTAPDGNGVRHQKAVTTIFDAATGAITDRSGIWVSHSFDQRYLTDGADLFELHLGDAYPREIVTSRLRGGTSGGDRGVYAPKGNTGANNTFTRLGGMARIDAGAHAGSYLVLYATERTTDVSTRVSGSRDLALTRLVPDFADATGAHVDDTLGATFEVTSGDGMVTNRAHFLTDFHTSAPGMRHAERPKLVPIGGGQFLVLFEQWALDGGQQFEGTYALRIDGEGATLAGPTRVSDHHLPRGDDAFAYGGGAAWVTGDSADRTLSLHVVAPDLGTTSAVIP